MVSFDFIPAVQYDVFHIYLSLNFQFFIIFFQDNVHFNSNTKKIYEIKNFGGMKNHPCRLCLIVKSMNKFKVNEFML